MPIIPRTTPSRVFGDHEGSVTTVVVSPHRRHMVTGSADNMLRLCNLEDGGVLKKMEGHRNWVQTLAVSRDGRFIASGDSKGEFIAWNGDTGISLTQAIQAHSTCINSLDFSPDGVVLATGSQDKTTKLWNTKTWQQQGKTISCSAAVTCVRYSPSGELLAIVTDEDIQIWTRNSKFMHSHKQKVKDALQSSKLTQLSMEHSTSHSHGRPMAHAFSREVPALIPQYGSGIHRPGSRSVIPGTAIITRSTSLL